MTFELQFIKTLKFLSILAILLCTSFLNYCLQQIFGSWFLPLTIIPIFVASFLEFQFPLTTIIFAGIFDDILLNCFLGLYPALYLLMEYLISEKFPSYRGNKWFIASFFLLFCLIIFLEYTIRRMWYFNKRKSLKKFV